MSCLSTYRILNTNIPAMIELKASSIESACEKFINRRNFRKYEYYCNASNFAKIKVFNNLDQEISSFIVMEVEENE